MGKFKKKLLIGVIGGHSCDKKTAMAAQELGREIAKRGAILVCGGLGGIMEAVAKGVKENGGITVGILPSEDKNNANPFIDIPIATGLGYTRNTLVTTSADIIIALKGEYGTLSEIGFALNAKKPVIGLGSWDIPGVIKVKTVKEAMEILESACPGRENKRQSREIRKQPALALKTRSRPGKSVKF